MVNKPEGRALGLILHSRYALVHIRNPKGTLTNRTQGLSTGRLLCSPLRQITPFGREALCLEDAEMEKKKYVTVGKLFYYRSKLLRKPTPPEVTFGYRLAGGRIKFLTQFVIPPYIVDFFIPKRMLIIELDGAHHYAPEQAAYDARRTAYLERRGFRVVRIPNSEVRSWPLKNIRKFPKCKGASRLTVNKVMSDFESRRPAPAKRAASQRVKGAPF